MRTTFIIAVMVMLAFPCWSQPPDWQWAKQSISDYGVYGGKVAADKEGNVVITGEYRGASLNFGNATITNINSARTDIFVTKYDKCGNVLWSKDFGGDGNDVGTDIATDSADNIYITGYTRSTSLLLGTFALYLGTDTTDMFIAKIDPVGNVLWAKKEGDLGHTVGNAICVDHDNNVIVTGTFSSPNITIGTHILYSINSGSSDIFIAKYDQDGNVKFAKSIGGIGWDGSGDVTTGINNEIFLTGTFSGDSMYIGSITISKIDTGENNVFIAELDSNGNSIWASRGGGNFSSYVGSVAVDSHNQAVITGCFNGNSFNLGGFSLWHSPGTWINNDFYIAKYDTEGNILWAKKAGGTDSENGADAVIDHDGNIFITGSFFSPLLSFDTFTLVNTGPVGRFDGNSALFIVEYDSLGNVIWATKGQSEWDVSGTGITLSSSNNIVTIGFFRGSIVFGDDSLTGNKYDLFLSNYGLPINSIGCATSVSNLTRTDLTVYPNPFEDDIYCKGGGYIAAAEVYDMVGRLIVRKDCNTVDVRLCLQNLSRGIYVLKLTEIDGRVVQRKIQKR